MQEADEPIAFQLPTKHTRIGYLIDNIQNNNPNLCADIAGICINMNGMGDDFENTVAFLLPMDPYSKQSNNSNKNAHITDVNLKGKFKSKTGLHFSWHKKDEYKKLTKEQHSKWYEWHKYKDGRDITNNQRQSSGENSQSICQEEVVGQY